ncbi:hypothetical protein [Micromonospora sp. RV43]|uniref:hypothetical protein n=1 Tax=Micromonospora sp. RV43 TaxID=1661387 RepID=UPI00064BE61D|nr:hypothetical protein [Micromonospora sp. RV43]
MYEVGNAFIQIIPSFENIEKHLAKGAKDIADQIGKAVGDALPEGFEDGAKKGAEQAEKQARAGGRKAAESYAGHFSDVLQKRMQAVAKALPVLKVDGDVSPFEQRLSEARKRVVDLASKPLPLDIDAGDVLRDVERLRDELRALRAQTGDQRLKLDLDVATAQVDKFLAEAHTVTERLGRDFSGAFDKILQDGIGKAIRNLPDAEIGVDVDSAEAQLAELRRVLKGLNEQTVGIDISEQDAMTVLHGVREQLDDLSRTAGSMRLRINADQTLRGLDATMAKLVTAAEEEAAKAAEDERKRREKQAEQERKERVKAAERERAELARADREDAKRREREAEQYWREQTRLAEQHLRERRQLQDKAAQEEKRAADKAQRDQERRNREAIRVAEEEFTRTFAGRISKGLEKAYSSLPNLDLGVNATDAEFAIRSIRDELRTLSRARIGIDVDAAEAQAQISFIKNELIELARANPTIDVHANAIAAATELSEIERIARRIDDNAITVRVNSNGADEVRRVGQEASVSLSRLEQLIAVGVSLGTVLVPAAAAAASAIGFIGTAAAATAAGIGVMALGFSGIGDAVKAMQQLDDDQAKSQASLSRANAQQVNSMEAIESAERSLANTRANNAEAARRAAQAVAEAERAVGDARREAAESVKQAVEREDDAERAYIRTKIDAREAREGLTRAYRDAVNALAELDSAVNRNAINQRQANLDVAKAKKELDAVLANPRASEAEREQAQITYDRRIQQVKDLQREGRRLAAEQAEANKKGVEGSDQVVAARRRIADADERASNAQRALERAREGVIRAQVDGQRRISDAQRRVGEAQAAQQNQARQAAHSMAEAQRSLAAAHRQAEQAAVRQGVAGGEALDNLNDSMRKLSPEAQNFAKFLFGLRDEVISLRNAASSNLLPGVQRSMETLLPYLPKAEDYIGRVARAIGDMFEETAQLATTDATWRRFFAFLDKETVPTLERLYRVGRNVATGVAGLYLALTPFNGDIGSGLEDLTRRFAQWATTLDHNQGFQEFLAYARENGPRVVELISQLVEFVGRFIVAAAPTGSLVVTAFTALARVLNALPMPVLQVLVGLMAAWSTGLLLLNVRTRLLAINSAVTSRLMTQQAAATAAAAASTTALTTATATAATQTGRLNKVMGGVKGAAGVARNAVAGVIGILGGPVGLAVAGAAVGFQVLSAASEEYNSKVDGLKAALGELGATYRRLTQDGRDAAAGTEEALRGIVDNNPEMQRAVVALDKLGIGFDQLAAAASGSKQDMDAVLGTLDKEIDRLGDRWQKEFLRFWEPGVAKGTSNRLAEMRQLREAIVKNADALGLSTQAQNAMNTAQDRSSALNQIFSHVHGPAAVDVYRRLAAQYDANAAKIEVLTRLRDVMNNSQATAIQRAEALRAVIEQETSATVNSIEAKESYKSKLLELDQAIKTNGTSLSMNSQAGLRNRDALEAAAGAVRERFLADIAAGKPMDDTTRKHNERIAALVKEAEKLGLDKKAARELISAYGDIPETLKTVYETKGFKDVYDELEKLQFAQYALKYGIDPANAEAEWRRAKAAAKGQYPQGSGSAGLKPRTGDGYGVAAQFFNAGGSVWGRGTSTSDSIPAWLSNGEFVQPAASVDYYGQGLMEAIRHRLLPREIMPGFAGGGSVNLPFRVTALATRVPSMDEVRAVALKSLVGTRSSGGIGSADMMRILRAVFPGLPLYSGFREGSRTDSGALSYHAMIAADGDEGRAVDLPPRQDVFDYIHDHFFAATRELIWLGDKYRNIWNGKHHKYSDSLLRKHGVAGMPGAHLHWAYDQGGYLPPGFTTVYNGTGRPEPVFTDGQWSQISQLLADRGRASAARSEIHNHFDFANSTLDESRLTAMNQRQDALNRLDRPNW